MMLTIWLTTTIDQTKKFTKIWMLAFKVITHCFRHPTTSFDLKEVMIVFNMTFIPNVLQKPTLTIIIFFILCPNEKL